MLDITSILLHAILNVIIIAPFLWLAGRALVGGQKAKFTDALWIVALGTVIGSILTFVVSGFLAGVIVLMMWLALIKHFFDCGWLKALVISIIAAIIFVVVGIVLGALGFVALRAIFRF